MFALNILILITQRDLCTSTSKFNHAPIINIRTVPNSLVRVVCTHPYTVGCTLLASHRWSLIITKKVCSTNVKASNAAQ